MQICQQNLQPSEVKNLPSAGGALEVPAAEYN